jgi:hypothetical protein
MTQGVYCEKCGREIKFAGDLVTTTFMFQVVPYHEDCFAKDLKGLRTFFVSNNPINGIAGNITVILSVIIGTFVRWTHQVYRLISINLFRLSTIIIYTI